MADVDIVFNVKDAGATQKIDNIKNSLNGASSIAGGATKAFSGMFGSILAGNLVSQLVTKSLNMMKDALVACVQESIDNQKNLAQLDAVLRSTNNAVGMSRQSLIDLSTTLQDQTTYSHDAVMSAENLLLTFTNIGKDIFPKATAAVIDMATAMGTDLKSASIQVGKALQDPILGVTALRRVGVNFNQAQMDIIKNLVNTGKAAQAQAMILKELATEFGGSAAAAANTFGGRLEQVRNQFAELKEAIGDIIVQNKDLVLALEGVVVLFKEIAAQAAAGKGFFGQMIQQFFGPTIGMLKNLALAERLRQAQAEKGRQQAEEMVKWIDKNGQSWNILGVNVVDAAKAFLGIKPAATGASGAILTLDQVMEKFKLQTRDELTAALNQAEQSMKTLKASTEATPGAVAALQKIIDELKESLYGKKEKGQKTIFDLIMEARKNPKFLEPIPIQIKLAETPLINMEFQNPARMKMIQKAIEFMNPPKKLAFDWKGVADDISRYWQDGIADMIAGTSSFRDFVYNSFNTLAAGAGSAIGKLATNALKGLGDMAGPIGSVIGGLATAAISGLGKLFGIKSKAQKEKEAAARAEAELKKQTQEIIASYARLGSVSDNTARSIAEATKTMGKARAEAKFFSDIIKDCGIRTDNLKSLWAKAIDIMAQTRKGTIPAREGVAALDDAFEQLIAGSRDLGKEFGRNVASFMIKFRDSGLQVGSAMEYMRAQLDRIPDAFTKLIKGAQLSSDRLSDMSSIARYSFNALLSSGSDYYETLIKMREGLIALRDKYAEMGVTADESINQLFRISDVAEKNKELFEAIAANKDIIEALGNSGWMTSDAMASLSRNALDFYGKLENAGMTSDEALRTMGPTLQRIYDYAKAYGLQLDANTQSMIDQAKAAGIISDETNAQAAAMDRVFKGFGDRMEGIMNRFGDRLATMFGVGGGGYGPSNYPGRGYASGGIAWYPQTARLAEEKPEAIIPLDQIASVARKIGGGGDRRGGPMIFNLQIAGKTLARLIAPDLETLQRKGRFRNDISTIVRNET